MSIVNWFFSFFSKAKHPATTPYRISGRPFVDSDSFIEMRDSLSLKDIQDKIAKANKHFRLTGYEAFVLIVKEGKCVIARGDYNVNPTNSRRTFSFQEEYHPEFLTIRGVLEGLDKWMCNQIDEEINKLQASTKRLEELQAKRTKILNGKS